MHILPELFLTFAKIGVFTFGGGYAMIGVIEDICVRRKTWITHDEMMNVTVIAESTPGPIAINCATYVGYKLAGLTGAVIATLGIVLPSFAIIYAIARFMDNFLEIRYIAAAFQGIKAGVAVLILDAGWMMLKKMKKNRLSVGIVVCACVMIFVRKTAFGTFVESVGINRSFVHLDFDITHRQGVDHKIIIGQISEGTQC